MNRSIIDIIKNNENKDEVIRLLEEMIDVLTEEFKLITDELKKTDINFVINLLELRATVLSEDLREIALYLKGKYGDSIGKDTDTYKLIELLCNNGDLKEL